MSRVLYAGHPRSYYRNVFKTDSDRLFRAAWRVWLWFYRNTDVPSCEYEVTEFLNQVMSEKVNDERSVFYMHG